MVVVKRWFVEGGWMGEIRSVMVAARYGKRLKTRVSGGEDESEGSTTFNGFGDWHRG